MKRPLPLLKARHSEPRRGPVLVTIVGRMASGQVMIGVQSMQEDASVVRPGIAPKAIQVITQVPCHIRVTREPRHRVANIAVLIFRPSNRMNSRVVPPEN